MVVVKHVSQMFNFVGLGRLPTNNPWASDLRWRNAGKREDRVKDLLRHPHATLGLSDAGAHLSFLCDAGFGLHLLGHWSRERGDIALPKAVQSVTSRVADAYRTKDRGRIVPGACADLLLFDPDTVGRGQQIRVQDLPAGATRVHTPARGVHGVWVNGTRVVDASGPVEGAGTPGSLLRDFAD